MNAHHPQYAIFIRGVFFGGVEDIEEGASRTLLALECFERAGLRQSPRGLDERAANANAAMRIAKSCAGLAHAYRMEAPQLRAAITEGRLDRRGRICFDWVLSGIRGYEIHELYNAWGLSIHALARTLTRSYGGRHALARWLNLWGTDPGRPLPEHDGVSRAERARERRRSEIAKWAAALRTPGAGKAQGCLEEAGDNTDAHPRRSVLGHACAALGCLRGATTANVDGRPVTRFAGPERDEGNPKIARIARAGAGDLRGRTTEDGAGPPRAEGELRDQLDTRRTQGQRTAASAPITRRGERRDRRDAGANGPARRADDGTGQSRVSDRKNPWVTATAAGKTRGGGAQTDARTHARVGPDEDGAAPDWEGVLARAVAEDDFATIAYAWEMCYPGESGEAAVRDLTEWD